MLPRCNLCSYSHQDSGKWKPPTQDSPITTNAKYITLVRADFHLGDGCAVPNAHVSYLAFIIAPNLQHNMILEVLCRAGNCISTTLREKKPNMVSCYNHSRINYQSSTNDVDIGYILFYAKSPYIALQHSSMENPTLFFLTQISNASAYLNKFVVSTTN